ncbi:MAG: hypothetical protein QOD06_1344, partial [Candidatus Binatota bacterium]|nr:hypothetical protein [Candidatus Binatota bacterium]
MREHAARPPPTRWSRSVLLSIVLTSAVRVGYAETLTVEDCVRLALEHSATVRAAALESRAAVADTGAAKAAYMPSFSANAEYGRAEGFDPAVTNGGSTA